MHGVQLCPKASMIEFISNKSLVCICVVEYAVLIAEILNAILYGTQLSEITNSLDNLMEGWIATDNGLEVDVVHHDGDQECGVVTAIGIEIKSDFEGVPTKFFSCKGDGGFVFGSDKAGWGQR